MIAKLGQTKRAVTIELVSVLILAFVFAAAQPSFAANPVQVPIATKTSPDIASVPTTVPKEAAIPAPETTAIAIKPVEAPALETIPESAAQVPVNKETLVTAPAPALVPKEALAMIPETASSPTPKELPASVLSPAQPQTSPSTPAETTQTTSLALVGGTAAAIIFAPIAAPVSIILGIAVGLFEPSSSQLGQVKSTPAKKPAARVITPSSDSTN